MADRAGHFPGNGAAGDCPVFLAGKRLGARLRISRCLVAGRRGAVERRDFFPAVDGVGEPRIRRAAIYFLSAAFVDAGGGAELCGSVERGAGSFYCYRADSGGTVFVCAGAAISAAKCGALRSGMLCGKSVCAAGRLHAQRLFGATGMRIDAVGRADRAAALRIGGESAAFRFAGDGVLRVGVRSGVAFQCASGGDNKLQRGAHFCVGCA